LLWIELSSTRLFFVISFNNPWGKLEPPHVGCYNLLDCTYQNPHNSIRSVLKTPILCHTFSTFRVTGLNKMGRSINYFLLLIAAA